MLVYRSVMDNDNSGSSEGGKTIQVETLPTASADELGNISIYRSNRNLYTWLLLRMCK